MQRLPARARLGIALGVVWITFGSAFVAVKVGVATVPPFLFSGSRFVLVGAALLAWSAWRAHGGLRLSLRDALISAVTGVGLIFAGQGAASWASQYLDPGIVAVLAATVPLWVVLFALAVLRTRPGPVAVVGLVAGFAGVVYLAWPAGSNRVELLPALVVTVGAICWAGGSLLASRSDAARRPLLMTAIQMLAGGTLQLLLGLATGEAGSVHVAQLGQALPVYLYLIAVPALIGFPVFTWLLANTPPHIANTQSYTAPVVALALGSLLLGEPVTPRTLAAVGVILAGVALIVVAGRPNRDAAVADMAGDSADLQAA
jgi:drug/metabolite transporter (DMT)-like permease